MKDFRKDPRYKKDFGIPTDSQMFFDGTDVGQLMNALLEFGKPKKTQTTPMPVDDPQQAVKQMMPSLSQAAPQAAPQASPQAAPQAAPKPSQAPETPQPPTTSETAPEPSPAPSKDPVISLGDETVKDAPPEIFK
jgi:hypothetical protein